LRAGRVGLRDIFLLDKSLSAEDKLRLPIDGKFKIQRREVSRESNYEYTPQYGDNHAIAAVRGPLCPFTQWMR
jgi:hypothetical protein